MQQRNVTVNIALELYDISRTEQLRIGFGRTLCEPVTHEVLVTPRLQSLAMMAVATNTLLAAEEVLPALFEEDAVALLLKVPNRYWFWKLMEVTALAAIATEAGRFTRARLLEAATLLQGMVGLNPMLTRVMVENIKDDLTGTREAKIALRAAAGLVLLVPSTDGTRHWLVDNPIFFDPAFQP